jgi:hypothetical protein
MPFTKVVNDQAYAKIGILGLQGSGKTYTAAEITVGLRRLLVEKGLPGGSQPIFMNDTETGSSWLADRFAQEGIPFEVSKTRSFRDLLTDGQQVAEVNGIWLIDSITHYWNELMEAYKRKHNRKRLTINDFGAVKSLWARFTDLYVNSAAHIVMCGRQGYEYDFFEDDDGKKQLEKTAVKMKAEGETGYEPSLLIVMERHQELDSRGKIERVFRTAYILKDRANVIDGKSFENPTFEDFGPHIAKLNLGGNHLGVDTSRTSDSIIDREESWKYEAEQRQILQEEITELIKKYHPSQTADDKASRIDLLEEFFSTRSWKKVETFSLQELKVAYNRLHNKLVGKPAYENLPLEDGQLGAFVGAGSEIPF